MLYHKRRPPPCALSTPGPGQHATPATRAGRASSRSEPTTLLPPYHWCDVAANTAREEEEEEEEQAEGRRQPGGQPVRDQRGPAKFPRGSVGRCDATATHARRPRRNTTPAEPPPLSPTQLTLVNVSVHAGGAVEGGGAEIARPDATAKQLCRLEPGAATVDGTGSVSLVAGVRRARQGAVASMPPPPTPLPGPPPEHCEHRRGAEAKRTQRAAPASTPPRQHTGQQPSPSLTA